MRPGISLKSWCRLHGRFDILSAYEAAGNSLPADKIARSSKAVARWSCMDCGDRWEESVGYATKRVHFCRCCGKTKASPWYNLETEHPEIAAQWDYAENQGDTPRTTLPASGRKAAWICPFNPGHKWMDRVGNRTLLLRDCPECSKQFHMSYAAMVLYYYLRRQQVKCECEKQEGKYLIDIALQLPGCPLPIALEVDGIYAHSTAAAEKRETQKDCFLQQRGYRVIRIKEADTQTVSRDGDVILWPYDKNGTYGRLDETVSFVIEYLTGSRITADHRRDHWQIRRLCYHEQKLRSLAVRAPQLAGEWSGRNRLGADMVTLGSHEKWLWSCTRCKRDYPATIHNRIVNGSGCPVCRRKIATEETCLAATHPEIAAQWDPEKNGDKTPCNTLSGTDYCAWWRCPNGHSYQANIYERTGKDKRSCPQCRSLAFRSPLLAQLYDEERNETPADLLRAYANGSCHWKCPKGHTWTASPKAMQRRRPERYCQACIRSRCDHHNAGQKAL